MEENCLFCKIVRKEVEAKILYENDDILVMLDAYPDTDGHTLVIPKKHYDDIYNLPDDVLVKLFDGARYVVPDLMGKLDKDALTYLINFGDAQKVPHVHLHLLPDFIHKTHELSNEEVYEKLMQEDEW